MPWSTTTAMGVSEDIDTADPQITTGGNIVIHKGK